jgi:hypothetical protein
VLNHVDCGVGAARQQDLCRLTFEAARLKDVFSVDCLGECADERTSPRLSATRLVLREIERNVVSRL